MQECSSCNSPPPTPSSNLEVCSHDFARLLVESLSVPVRIEFGQSAYQTIVFTQHECVDRGQSDVLIGATVT